MAVESLAGDAVARVPGVHAEPLQPLLETLSAALREHRTLIVLTTAITSEALAVSLLKHFCVAAQESASSPHPTTR